MTLTMDDLIKYFHKVTCSCGAVIGEVHRAYCDVARCRKCGTQAAWCEHKWKPDIWTGFWPGTIECVEFGWFTKWDGPRWPEKSPTGKGWVPCDGDDPDAAPDLNRLASETVYDQKTNRRVLRIDL